MNFTALLKKLFLFKHLLKWSLIREVFLKRLCFITSCSKAGQVFVVMVGCSCGWSVRVSLVPKADGAGSEAEGHPGQSQGTALGSCSGLGNSEHEEDTVKWLKVARPAHVLYLRLVMFVRCPLSFFLPAKGFYFLFSSRVKKVPSVPESLLKKRQAYAVMKAKRQKKILAIKKVNVL